MIQDLDLHCYHLVFVETATDLYRMLNTLVAAKLEISTRLKRELLHGFLRVLVFLDLLVFSFLVYFVY